LVQARRKAEGGKGKGERGKGEREREEPRIPTKDELTAKLEIDSNARLESGEWRTMSKAHTGKKLRAR